MSNPNAREIPVHKLGEFKIPSHTTSAAADIDTEKDLPTGIRLTGGEKLRQKGLTGKGVKVAVIDSGVDADHEGFGGKVTHQSWFRWGSSLEEDDHGTHVAGTIHMMAPDAEIMDYRVFGAEGWPIDDAIYTSIVEACFDGADIINMSLGGRFASPAIRTAVEYANSKGVIVVAAAGNEGDGSDMTIERSFPALWDECISIGAVQKEKGLPSIYFSNTNPQVDYAGIGVNVVSFKPGGGFQNMSGTSMASPHVCGLLTALLDKEKGNKHMKKDSDNERHDENIRKWINKHICVDIGLKGPDKNAGLGFLTYLSKKEFDAVFETEPEPEE